MEAFVFPETVPLRKFPSRSRSTAEQIPIIGDDDGGGGGGEDEDDKDPIENMPSSVEPSGIVMTPCPCIWPVSHITSRCYIVISANGHDIAVNRQLL